MVWPRLSRETIAETLRYFDRYDYPLTKREVVMWSTSPLAFPSPKLRRGVRGEVEYKNGFYFLKNRSHLGKIRKQREVFSRPKWQIAYAVVNKLKKMPFIEAIFVTGSLAMNNCKAEDDIDLMIITVPNTLWITRFFVNIYLSTHRRYPKQESAPDKICPNLWLDTKNLKITSHNLYIAHEILQAKCLFDRCGIHREFLGENEWVKEYLPNVYLTLLRLPSPSIGVEPGVRYWWLGVLNLVFFAIQYLYMFPKITTEKVGPGFAFFHPRPSPS